MLFAREINVGQGFFPPNILLLGLISVILGQEYCGKKLLNEIFLLPSRFTTFPKILKVSAFVKSYKTETQTITS